MYDEKKPSALPTALEIYSGQMTLFVHDAAEGMT